MYSTTVVAFIDNPATMLPYVTGGQNSHMYIRSRSVMFIDSREPSDSPAEQGHEAELKAAQITDSSNCQAAGPVPDNRRQLCVNASISLNRILQQNANGCYCIVPPFLDKFHRLPSSR